MSEQCPAVPLAPVAFPLANQFYRTHRSRMRARGHHRVLVLRDAAIFAALCLQPAAQGHWLTNLMVAPERRGLGWAGHLLAEARRMSEGPIWLFCHPELEPFYQRAGYSRCEILPPALSERLARYRQSKPLIAMLHGGG
jgi:GNAT superfamily N-acetyltransferase